MGKNVGSREQSPLVGVQGPLGRVRGKSHLELVHFKADNVLKPPKMFTVLYYSFSSLFFPFLSFFLFLFSLLLFLEGEQMPLFSL